MKEDTNKEKSKCCEKCSVSVNGIIEICEDLNCSCHNPQEKGEYKKCKYCNTMLLGRNEEECAQKSKSPKPPQDISYEMCVKGDWLVIRDILNDKIIGMWNGSVWDIPPQEKGEECVKGACKHLKEILDGGCETIYTPPKPDITESWKKRAAKIALEAHKKTKHYAEFSEIIYQGVKEVALSVREETIKEIEGMKKEDDHGAFCDCSSHGYNEALRDIIDLLKAKD